MATTTTTLAEDPVSSPEHEAGTGNPEREGAIMLTKAIIGAAALVFPRCYQRSGVVPATLALLVAGYAGVVVGDLLMETRKSLGPKCSTFRDMALFITGSSFWAGVLDFTVTLQSFGTLVGYVVACGDLLSGTARKLLDAPESIQVTPPDLVSSLVFGGGSRATWTVSLRALCLLFLTVCLFFPLCLLRRLESLRSLAASTIVIYAFFLLVLFKVATARVLGSAPGGGQDEGLNWTSSGLEDTLRVLPIIALSYSCVPLMFEVRRALEKRVPPGGPRADKAWRAVAVQAFCASGFFYVATGLLGYTAFRSSTSANVLTNLESMGVLASAVNAMFAASLIVSYPLIGFVVRAPLRRMLPALLGRWGGRAARKHEKADPLYDAEVRGGAGASSAGTTALLPEEEDVSFFLFAMEAAIVTGGTLAAAVAVPGIDVVLEIIGGTAAVFVSYVAPVGLFLAVKPARTYEKDKNKAIVIGVVGVFIGMLTVRNVWLSLA